MADQKDDQQSQQQQAPKTGAADKSAGQLEPGESNARAVRNTEGTGGGARTGRRTDAAGGTDAGATGATTDSATGPVPAGQQRVRMMRTDGERRVGQVLVLPKDEADRLVQSGAAEAIQTS